MTGPDLKSSGKLLLWALFAVLVTARGGMALEVVTLITPSSVPVGTAAVLQIKISGAETAEPAGTPRVDGLDIAYSGIRRSFEFVNGKTWSGIVLNFTVVPSRPGTFTIPSFEIRVDGNSVATGSVRLSTAGTPIKPGGRRGGVVPVTDLSSQAVFIGQPVIIRYFIVHQGLEMGRKPVFEKMPLGRDFIVKQVDEKIQDAVVKVPDGERVKTHVATFAALPAREGVFQLGGGAAVVELTDESSFFSFPRRLSVSFETRRLHVKALPGAGRPAGFRGDTGVYSIQAGHVEGPVKVFGEKVITVSVRGKGNLLSLSEPVAAGPDGLKVLVKKTGETVKAGPDSLEGEVTYSFSLIPEKPGRVLLKEIGLDYFNPYTGRYEHARAGPLVFEASDEEKVKEKDNAGSDGGGKAPAVTAGHGVLLTIFLVIAAACGGIVFWEVRRYRGHMNRGNDPSPQLPAETQASREPDFRRELYIALKREDHDRFLKTAEKAVRRIMEGYTSNARDVVPEALEEVRVRINVIKYAGRRAAPDELDALYEDLLRYLPRREW